MPNRRHDWTAVQDYVRDRMTLLRMTQADLARKAGISEPTARGFISGTPRGIASEKTRWAVCDALEWQTDSIDLILSGEEPVPVDPVEARLMRLASPGIEVLDRSSDRLELALLRLARLEERVGLLEAHRHDQVSR